jgi:hypothetical protein
MCDVLFRVHLIKTNVAFVNLSEIRHGTLAASSFDTCGRSRRSPPRHARNTSNAYATLIKYGPVHDTQRGWLMAPFRRAQGAGSF